MRVSCSASRTRFAHPLVLDALTLLVSLYTAMALVNRGRLSVQRVQDDAWDVICQLTETGNWDESATTTTTTNTGSTGKRKTVAHGDLDDNNNQGPLKKRRSTRTSNRSTKK